MEGAVGRVCQCFDSLLSFVSFSLLYVPIVIIFIHTYFTSSSAVIWYNTFESSLLFLPISPWSYLSFSPLLTPVATMRVECVYI